MIRAACLAVGLNLAGGAAAEIVQVVHDCERGVEIAATYVSGMADAENAVILLAEGRMVLLVQVPAASGARYGGPAGQSGYVWWARGAEAMLAWFDADLAEEVTLFTACRVRG